MVRQAIHSDGLSPMKVTVNGEAREIRPGTTIADLLRESGWSGSRIAVERNQQVVPRPEFAGIELEEGDRIEVVRFVGGGR